MPIKIMTASAKRFLLLYGSQTGQAEAIAENICEKCVEAGFSPDLHCTSDFEKKFNILEEGLVVVVVSTTGEGEPPDTVYKFWRKLKRKTNPSDMLKNMRYALLGLGDSNYTNFCNMGKMLNERLLQLGATKFYESGFADDGVGLEVVVEPWIDGLLPALHSVFTPSSDNDPLLPPESLLDNISSQEVVGSSSSQGGENVVEKGEKLDDKGSATLADIDSVPVPDSGVMPVSDYNSKVVPSDSHVSQQLSNETSLLTLESSSIAYEFTDFERTLRGDDELSWQTKPFNVPTLQQAYLEVTLSEKEASMDVHVFDFNESVRGVAMAPSPVTMARVTERKVLTSADAEKKTLELTLSWEGNPECSLSYEPGDALCFICPNDSWEVEYLLERLKLTAVKNQTMSINILKGTSKRNPVVPRHIPPSCTVFQYLKHCADIRAVLKKSSLSVLSQFCSNEKETARLQWLSSRQGSEDYSKLILESHLDLLDILHAFPSCNPPLSRLVECVPRLQPRHYSAASSPLLSNGHRVKIVFNITVLPERTWCNGRSGLCSSWLDKVSLNLPYKPVVPVFARLKNPFHLPTDLSVPVIMIGPGTGIAPFMGFLEHRLALQNSGATIGPSWLFFGCRHPDRDYLYRDQLRDFVNRPPLLTYLDTSFSRLDSVSSDRKEYPKYVQDNIRKHCDKLSQWIMEKDAVIYVCGDAKNMARNIRDAIMDVIQHYTDKTGSSVAPSQIMIELQENQRYIVDQWL